MLSMVGGAVKISDVWRSIKRKWNTGDNGKQSLQGKGKKRKAEDEEGRPWEMEHD
jgi:hypothetical protein